MQRSGVDKRLRKLVRLKYIDRFCIADTSMNAALGYFLTNKGVAEFISEKLAIKDTKLKSEKIEHDLLLSDIRFHLKRFDKILEIYSENDIIYNSSIQIHPAIKELKEMRTDSALKVRWKNQEIFIALEYEMSLKAASRYDDTFKNYYKKENLDAILYICKDRYIANNLMNIENKYNDSKEAMIYYATLEDVLTNSLQIPFLNRFGKLFPVFMDSIK